MRKADRYTIDTLGVPSLTLMERAGEAVAAQAERMTAKEENILVVCGGGNNGGDGFVAARLLRDRGRNVQVLCLAERFSADCEAERARFDGEILTDFPEREYSLIIDCVFGTGLSRTVEGAEKALIEWIERASAAVLSVDIPSGLNGDNGLAMGVCVHADCTLSIGEYKIGQFLNDGIDCCGELLLADIGIDSSTAEKCVGLLESTDIFPLFPRRKRNSNKGTYGKASILAGSVSYSGAPILTATASLRSGAGYTELCVCERLFSAYTGRLPEAILTLLPGEDAFRFEPNALEKLLKSDCVAIGPGCGVSEELYRIVAYFLKHYTGKLVLDADALNALSYFGTDVLSERTCTVLLTPHIKEFSRLSGASVAEIQADPVGLARSFAKKYGVNLLLKSHVSVLTDGERTALNTRGGACLAKGGSGDVLTGILASLAAQGLDLFSCAQAGSFLMGLSAEICERELGVYGVLASDVIACLPRAWVGLSAEITRRSE